MNEERVRQLAANLIEAAEVYASRDEFRNQSRETLSVWWSRIPEAEAIVRRVVLEVMRSNRRQLSYYDTEHALTYAGFPALVSLAAGEPSADKEQLELGLRSRILALSTFTMMRKMQFVVENINIDGAAPLWFGVDLQRPSDDERGSLYRDALIRPPRTNALGLATIEAPGDNGAAFESAIDRVERYLNLLRGCGVQALVGGLLPFHVIDRNPIVEDTPSREWDGLGFRTTGRTQYGARRCAALRADLLADLSPANEQRILQATTGTTTSMLDAVVASLETLGEASKPNLPSTRLLTISTALETLVGGRESGSVSFRGQTAAIAERATFLVGGETLDQRLDFHRRVRALYRQGSAVRHGAHPEVPHSNIEELAKITRALAEALLDRSDRIKTQRDLDEWVQRMRYSTGPDIG